MRNRPSGGRLPALRLALAAATGAAVALVAVGKPRSLRWSEPTAIASSGGTSLEILPAEVGRHYLQADPRWGADKVGNSGQPLSAIGCTVCAVAMAASSLGYDLSPGELNARLSRLGGYTGRGWLIWARVTAATEGRIAVHVPSQLLHSEIDKALQGGRIPVVKFFLAGGIPHWVAIAGKSGREYLVKDPLDPAGQVILLSSRTDTIVSVRYVMRR